MLKPGAITFLLLWLAISASAQNTGLGSEACPGRVYTRKEVSRPAKMIDEPNFKHLYEVFGNGINGRVRLAAVLCRSGQVTDIRVINSEPPKIGELVAAALRLVRFKPAEMNWHTVSQRQQFEFNVNNRNGSLINVAAAAARSIDALDIIGNRRMTKDQILALIKTRPGEIYNHDQIQRDLSAILASGYFNSLGTRVLLEDAVTGGVRVIIEVQELPLIAGVRFEGLKEPEQSAIVEELRRQNLEVGKGTPCDSAKLKKAARIIESFLESRGWREAKAEIFSESLSATEVAVTFKITAYKFGS
jgi:TonB family protein